MIFDERKFIARVTKATVDEFAQILSHPSPEEERALRVHLGKDRYERMHRMALEQTAVSRALFPSKGNVVVINGIMGSELSDVNSSSSDLIWLSYWHLFRGWAERLRLNAGGLVGEFDIRATGIMKEYYGEMLLLLRNQNWNVQAFWFDWRKNLDIAADQLFERIKEWFGETSPVHIVAHSMGGLVARTFIKRHPTRWNTMWDAKNRGQTGGRLVMAGTPNYGSFIIPQVMTGLEPVVRKLAFLDCPHGRNGILKIINTFPGSLQMLPSPFVMKSLEALYDAKTYGDLGISQKHLDNARIHHQLLRDVVDDERMIYIAGYNRLTPSDILDMSRLDSHEAYDVTKRGDGRVTHTLGIPRKSDDQPIKHVYYIDETHSDLLKNRTIVELMNDLLLSGVTNKLKTTVSADVRATQAEDAASKEAMQRELIAEQDADVEQFREIVSRLKQTQRSRASVTAITDDEQRLRESLTRGYISYSDEWRQGMAQRGKLFGPVPLELRVEWAFIQDIGTENTGGSKNRREHSLPVDALAVGHYQGVGKTLMAELALDKAISFELNKTKYENADKVPEAERLLTLYSERGIIRGALGHPFFINDPRSRDGRIIALAGMGEPGRFGAPELVVLARELCWSLGRMKKRHLATVLIGGGKDSLSIKEAVSAWLRGARWALTASEEDKDFRLQRITFVEVDARKIEDMQRAIKEFAKEEEARQQDQKLKIKYEELNLDTIKNKQGLTLAQEKAKINRRKRAEFKRSQEQQKNRSADDDKKRSSVPTWLTLTLEGKTYRYGAITETGSVPERNIPLDPSLVMEANDRIPTLYNINTQLEWGRYMENLLLPDDLRPAFSTKAPIIMTLDSTAARIHWEMIAQPDLLASVNKSEPIVARPETSDPFSSFLGTSRGFTRQLRTAFAPPPEPPPPPRRLLRVLVVADPWAERRLPGAEAEGEEVASLFESFNTVWNSDHYKIEVKRLIGPEAATRNEVLFHLTRRGPYDILHFAGHCMYDKDEPSTSGWLFTNGQRLSANELNRIDQIPKFVFSNACESGITPDRNWSTSGGRTAALAPSFAESFFARGVSNFVCTAWYVNDTAAREFARKLYAELLGIKLVTSDGQVSFECSPEKSQKMHVAMHNARLAIARESYGAMTWGAYQHYGNPYLAFFDNAYLIEQCQTQEKTRAPRGKTKPTSKRSNSRKPKKKRG